MSGGSTAFYLLPYVVTEVRRLETNTGMGFRRSSGSQRAGGCEIASRKKEVRIPRLWQPRGAEEKKKSEVGAMVPFFEMF
jgi:hypothetical protein